MEINGITIVVSSRETTQEKQSFIEMISRTCGYQHHILFITNNGGAGLTRVYNEALTQAPYDIVVFIHDDIDFLKEGWGAEIVRLFQENKEYGIIGVAGSAEFDSNAAWWQYKNIYGQVLHRHEGRSWLSAFSPLLTKDLEEVCVVDGLCFAVDRNKITQRFDERFEGFHMYEIDFCLSNFLDNKIKIGVTTNIRLAHNSIGALSDSWYEARDILNDKFKNKFPIKVKK